MKARFLGLLMLAAGLAAGWFFLWRPLELARTGASEVEYSLKAFVLVPAFVVAGCTMLVAGPVNYRNVETKRFTPLGWVLFGVIAALSAAGYFWFQQQFEALGYQ